MMKKMITAFALASLLSGCQVFDQFKDNLTTLAAEHEVKKDVLEENSQFKKLDEQFERVKHAGVEIDFNGEKYWKMTRAVKGDDPRFISLAVSVDRTNRKSLTSDTIYLRELSHEFSLIQSFLSSIKLACEPQIRHFDEQPYYVCSGNDAKSFIAVVYKDRNILSFRSLKSYQRQPTESEEKSIVKALIDYPVDSSVY